MTGFISRPFSAHIGTVWWKITTTITSAYHNSLLAIDNSRRMWTIPNVPAIQAFRANEQGHQQHVRHGNIKHVMSAVERLQHPLMAYNRYGECAQATRRTGQAVEHTQTQMFCQQVHAFSVSHLCNSAAQQQWMWTTGSDIKRAATCAAFCKRASRHTGVCLASSSFVFRGAELQQRGWRKTEVCQKQATALNEWRVGVFKSNSGVSKRNRKPMRKTHRHTELE